MEDLEYTGRKEDNEKLKSSNEWSNLIKYAFAHIRINIKQIRKIQHENFNPTHQGIVCLATHTQILFLEKIS